MTVASHESYQKIVGGLKGRLETIYAYVKASYRPNIADEFQGATYSELAEMATLKVNVVTGRLSDLADLGLIKGVTTRGGQTAWAPSAAAEVDALAAERRRNKRGVEAKVLCVYNDPENSRAVVSIGIDALSSLKTGDAVRVLP